MPALATHPLAAHAVERLGEIRDIHELVPSPLNPRKSLDKTKLEELAASIKAKGIIEPLIVRQRAGLGQLEIVAGERRYRAAKIAGLTQLPVIIRTLSDVEVLELMAIENSQRDDLHPLEEADGYAALMKADPAYTPKAIAAKIGKSERYVHQRLELGRLIGDAKKAFLANQITAGHADLLARLPPADQGKALHACFDHLYGEDKDRGCISVRQLDGWIKQHVRLQLAPDNPELATFPQLGKLVTETPKIETLLQVHSNYGQQIPGVLDPRSYKTVEGKKGRCPHTERAIMVLGSDRGELVDICRAKSNCRKHWNWEMSQAAEQAKRGTTKAKRPPADVARERRQRLWSKVRPAAIAAAAAKGDKLTPGVLQVLAYGIERWHYTGRKVTLADVVKAAAQFAALGGEESFARRVAKPLGINLAALFKAAVPQTAATKKKRKAA